DATAYADGGVMQRGSNVQKNEPTKWTGPEWERAWQSALRRINGMPSELACCPRIHECVMTIEEAFMHGDSKQFEAALIVLLDHCAELVNHGAYQQWW